MRASLCACVAGTVVLSAANVAAQSTTSGPSLRTLPAATTVAFVDVSVIPMDRERVIQHQTVVVRDGRIATMGRSRTTAIPSGATRVDGAGKFLMPGLMDMHAHFSPGTEDLAEPAGRQLALYLTTGFTTVRGLGGAPTAIGLRDRIARGELLGPSLVVASPSINGSTAHSIADVLRLVDEAKRGGFDLVKTHGNFPSGAFYDTLAAATKRAGLPLSGHVTPEFGLRKAMAAGQQVEHLDGIIAEILRPDAPSPGGGQVVADVALLQQVDSARLTALANDMAQRGIWNGPTLALFEVVATDSTVEELSRAPELRYAPAASVKQYAAQKSGTYQIPADGRRAFVETRRRIVRALSAAGAKMLIGSDSPQLFLIPGYSALRELDAFVVAGLSPYTALEAATRNPAEYLGRAADAGTVATGKRADLILLDANPLQSIANVRRLSGLMLNGRWIGAAQLTALREAIVAALPKT
jgi:imidazolonepropionase-like amidohydrolase